MFDFVRNNTRLALGFMLLLIIPSFIFVGVEGYTKNNDGTGAAVAKVDGRNITRAEWDNAHQRQLDRARQQMPGVDLKQFDTPQARTETLDALVRQRVLLAAANGLNLSPSDARLQRLFASDPQFAGVRNPDGSVNRELLATQGMSSEGFAQQLRQEFGMQQVLAGVTKSGLAPASIAGASLDPLLQRRDVQYQRYDAAAYRDKVSPTDAEIEAFYKAQATQFQAPEQASIEYVSLDLEALSRTTAVTDEDLRKFYADNAARFTAPEERKASHILINADKKLPAVDREKAKARAQALLVEARKTPAQFAELARKNSQDTGSAVQGGDLGFFGRGNMVKPFEDAAFAMKAGDISELVETEYGYHIINLIETKGGQKRPFDEVKATIEGEMRKAAALKRWPELAEQFTNTVYEQSESLQPVLDKMKLEKKTATVQRRAAPGTTGALASSKLLDSIFGSEVLNNKRNTDAVEVGPNQLVSARVLQHTPARVLPLADVKDRVRDRLVAQQAQALARKEGQDKLAQLQQPAGANEALSTNALVSRAQPQNLPREVLEAALRADASKLPLVTGVDLQGQGFVVLRVRAVQARDPAVASEEQLRGQYAQAWSAAEADAYVAALKVRFKADVKPEAAAAAITAAAGSAASAPR
jgi:peptidyl-prolyl cis-trans isomerase D